MFDVISIGGSQKIRQRNEMGRRGSKNVKKLRDVFYDRLYLINKMNYCYGLPSNLRDAD